MTHTLVEKLSKTNWQNIKGKFHLGRSWSSAKLLIVQNHTENVNGMCLYQWKICGISVSLSSR